MDKKNGRTVSFLRKSYVHIVKSTEMFPTRKFRTKRLKSSLRSATDMWRPFSGQFNALEMSVTAYSIIHIEFGIWMRQPLIVCSVSLREHIRLQRSVKEVPGPSSYLMESKNTSPP